MGLPTQSQCRPWTDVFRKSRSAPAVFNVKPDREEVVLAALDTLGPSVSDSGMMFSHYYESWPLLDGWASRFSPYGFPGGLLSRGLRVIGYQPFRLLCHLLELRAPRRFKGEPPIPTTEQLLAELEACAKETAEERFRHAQLGMVGDTESLRALVFQTWGGSIGTLTDQDKRQLPGEGKWGENGFNLYKQEKFEALEVSVEEAIDWSAIKCDGDELLELHPHGLAEIRRWVEAGFPPYYVRRYLNRDYTFDRVKQYADAGVDPRFIDEFIESGCTSAQAAGYFKAGLELREAMDLAEIGVSIEAARPLLDSGVSTKQIMGLLRGDWTPNTLETSSESEREAAIAEFLSRSRVIGKR
jgi:hypothetical protein